MTTMLFVPTLEGGRKALIDDYIINGMQGEFHPWKPNIFKATYEPVEDGT